MNTQDNVSASSANQESTAAILAGVSLGNSQTDTFASEPKQPSGAQQSKQAVDGDINARVKLAMSPDLSESVQAELLRDKAEAVLVALAGNPSLIEAGQERLASTGSPAIRVALAINPALNEKQQHYLAATGSDEVKCQLAKNRALIEHIRAQFAEDDNAVIRAALAGNPSLDKAYLDKLMNDTDVGVQCELARNPALTVDLQEGIASSGCDIWVLQNLARNASLSDALMGKFAVSPVDEVRESVASNPSLPESLQARLIANNRGNVLKNIAHNPALKIAQQAELANAGNIDVRLGLLNNPALDEQIKNRVIASFTQSDLSSAERAVEYAEQRANRLNTEYADACEKHYKSMGGIFPASDAKVEHLYKNIERAQKRQDAALNECTDLMQTLHSLQDAMAQQINQPGDAGTGFTFGKALFH